MEAALIIFPNQTIRLIYFSSEPVPPRMACDGKVTDRSGAPLRASIAINRFARGK
jgi:hypothetical protein